MNEEITKGAWELRVEEGGELHLYVHNDFQSLSCVLERKDLQQLRAVIDVLIEFGPKQDYLLNILEEIK